MKTIFLLLVNFVWIFASNNCEEAFTKVSPEAKQYSRIFGHKNEYNSSCNIVYAYSIFLHNPLMMEELEKNNVFSEQLGEFVKKYPYIAQFIINKKIFYFFNAMYSHEKERINEAVKYSFTTKSEIQNKANIIYIQLALEIMGKDTNTRDLKRQILELKSKYTLDDLETIYPFWQMYKSKYKEKIYNKKKMYKHFKHMIDEYQISFLKSYKNYRDDFFPVLLPEAYDNMKYIKTIKALHYSMRSNTMEQQAYFLKNISIDIQIALANGNSKLEIVNYYKSFINKEFIVQFGNLTCRAKQGLSMLVSDNLDYKLDWINYDEGKVFKKIIVALQKENNIERKINILGLYNYAAIVYSKMETDEQKKMINNIISLPTENTVFNLSLIYALGENTNYFHAIINGNYQMYKHEKYKDILYERQEGESILTLFAKGDKKFNEQVNKLVETDYENIHDITGPEILKVAGDVAEYASWATMIVPGAGIAMQIGKALVKSSLKAGIKQITKQGIKKNTVNGLKKMKEGVMQYGDDAVMYTGKKSTDDMINKSMKKIDWTSTSVIIGVFVYNHFFSSKQEELCKEQ